MKLKDLIAWLEKQPQDAVVINGFGYAHSYRGYYEDLAFTPVSVTTVEEMLSNANKAIGSVFQGWKGGGYHMNGDTRCWIAYEGSTVDEPISEDTLSQWEAYIREINK